MKTEGKDRLFLRELKLSRQLYPQQPQWEIKHIVVNSGGDREKIIVNLLSLPRKAIFQESEWKKDLCKQTNKESVISNFLERREWKSWLKAQHSEN